MSNATFARFTSPRRWCFCIRGYGVLVNPLRGHKPLFTERYGYHKRHRLFGCCIGILTPRA